MRVWTWRACQGKRRQIMDHYSVMRTKVLMRMKPRTEVAIMMMIILIMMKMRMIIMVSCE